MKLTPRVRSMAEQSPHKEGLNVLTFGCRLNAFESEVMARKGKEAGLDAIEGGAILVNSCAVTAEAVRQAKQAIRKARRDHPRAKIIVTGCAAQTEPETFGCMEEVDLVIGNDDKLRVQSYRAIPEFGLNSTEKVRVNDIMEIRETAAHMVDTMDGHTRAFVQVQNGCDHRCTFCIIPYGRGNSRSVAKGEVVEQIKKLVGNGYREVVLTGVDTTSYGADLPGQPSLGDLVQSILHLVPDLARLRLSSIDSIEVDEPLLEVIAGEPRFMPHLHLSLQHGDDLILKRMARRHNRTQSIEFCDRVRGLRPDMVFGADLIAGFPTETEDHFENTKSIVDRCGLTHLHVFPFSPRKGTPAHRMPQLERAVVKQRARELREIGNLRLAAHLTGKVGRTEPVLVERNGMARTEDFTAVRLADAAVAPGEVCDVALTGVKENLLTGAPVGHPQHSMEHLHG